MANIFQKIFLPKSKLSEINLKQEILQLVKSYPIMHNAYVTKRNGVARRFSIKTPTYHIYAERTFEQSRPVEHEIQYTLLVQSGKQIVYATHSEVDKFTQHVYEKMYKIWDKKKQHVK